MSTTGLNGSSPWAGRIPCAITEFALARLSWSRHPRRVDRARSGCTVDHVQRVANDRDRRSRQQGINQ